MAKTAIDKNNPKSKVNLTIPLALIFVLMVTMIFYTSHVIRRVAVSNINEVGDDRISNAAAEIENYLDTAKSVLWVTADTVDHMSQNGAMRAILSALWRNGAFTVGSLPDMNAYSIPRIALIGEKRESVRSCTISATSRRYASAMRSIRVSLPVQ